VAIPIDAVKGFFEVGLAAPVASFANTAELVANCLVKTANPLAKPFNQALIYVNIQKVNSGLPTISAS
jgi:hypothetical protein